jgi:molybdenum cofactor cytidylyltransferase
MGRFKPLLPFGKSTVIESTIDCYLQARIRNIIVVVGTHADELRGRLGHLPITFADNPDLESDMSTSIVCAIRVLPESIAAILISPADHPAIPPEVVHSVVQAWQEGSELVKPTWHERGGHPVLVDMVFREELLKLEPSVGLRWLFSAYLSKVRRVAVDSPFIVRDLDTWDDYRALHQDVFGCPPPVAEPFGNS